MKGKGLLIITFCLFAFLLVFFLLQSQEEEVISSESETEEEEEEVVSQPVDIKKAMVRGWQQGELTWLLEAERMELDKNTTEAHCQGGVKLVVLEAGTQKERATLVAERARINLDQNQFRFLQEVKATSASGDRIETSVLEYRDEEEILQTDTPARVYFDGNYLECQSLISDIDFKNPEFFGVQSGRFSLGEGSPSEE
ncbi:MAG: hypothetical protein PWP04_1865 [Candidatus Atribacteria bacterium]|nr:hypothetical protein [Candidatus Atribacteria bacterium]